MREGATLEQALEGCLDDLDGFYTFAVGTADGFAVLRDPIACKPAVMAETDDWVAMASEYRAIAVLPGAEDAVSWEPEPGRVYSWGTARWRDGRRRRSRRAPALVRSAPPTRARAQRRLHSGESARGACWSPTPTAGTASPSGSTPPYDVEIEGHVGYYCAGMNKQATVRVRGNCGVGVAENMMSGNVIVDGSASQAAGATARGGLLVIHGDASARCGISLKGADIVVRGSVGHMSAFMAQKGCLVVCGDAGEALGDSLYEARLYVRGAVAGLGADCVEKEMREEHVAQLRGAAGAGRVDADPSSSAATARRAGSTTSRSTTSGLGLMSRRRSHRAAGSPACASRRRSIATRSPRSSGRRARGCTTSAASAPSAAVPHFDDLLFLGASVSRYPLEGYRERCATDVTIGTRFAREPVQLDIPITIAGMSFGALSGNAKEALGRGASEVGTSTTTGDGGMTPEEREHSPSSSTSCCPPATG